MNSWETTVEDCITGPIFVHGVWVPKSDMKVPPGICGCGCGIWIERCFFCKTPTLSCNSVQASKGGTKYRFSCLPCSNGREIDESFVDHHSAPELKWLNKS